MQFYHAISPYAVVFFSARRRCARGTYTENTRLVKQREKKKKREIKTDTTREMFETRTYVEKRKVPSYIILLRHRENTCASARIRCRDDDRYSRPRSFISPIFFLSCSRKREKNNNNVFVRICIIVMPFRR